LYAAGDAWLASDQACALECNQHLIRRWRRDAKVALQVNLGRWPTKHQRVAVDESQILTLLRREARQRRGETRLESVIHLWCPQWCGGENDCTVSGRSGGTVEDEVGPSAHAWHELDTKEAAEAEYGLALAMGICVERFWLDLGSVLQQTIQNVDSFPNSTGNEAGEQRDIGFGDVVVGDTSVSAVANVTGAEKIVLTELDVGAIGDGGAATAPVLWQGEAGVPADHINHRRLQLVSIDMLGVDSAQRLRRGNVRGMASGLTGTEIAAPAGTTSMASRIAASSVVSRTVMRSYMRS
jgi:hypothetical protein